jgi:hypothetical protein
MSFSQATASLDKGKSSGLPLLLFCRCLDLYKNVSYTELVHLAGVVIQERFNRSRLEEASIVIEQKYS